MSKWMDFRIWIRYSELNLSTGKVLLSLMSFAILFILLGCMTNNHVSKQHTGNSKGAQATEGDLTAPVIITDSEVGLQVRRENSDAIVRLMRFVAIENSMSSDGHEVPVEKVRNFVSLRQLRPISMQGSNNGLVYYSAHDSSEGRLFVFYVMGRNDDLSAYTTRYVSLSASLEGFGRLVIGKSTLNDVKKIDPLVLSCFITRNDGDDTNWHVLSSDRTGMSGEYEYLSVHAVGGDSVSIGYKKERDSFIVEDIRTAPDELLAVINRNDYPK